MKMRFLVYALAISLSSMAYAQEIVDDSGKDIDPANFQLATNVISDQVRDPASLQFRRLRPLSDGFCGEFNAKNGFGGYAGFTVFRAFDDGTVLILDPSDIPEMRELKLLTVGKCITE